MKEKTYTIAEAKAETARFIREQALILGKNLREKRASFKWDVCIK
ncbi:MAG: hypothetical protein ACD_78C00027G0004 [uncultured bacterium (gcode 4)]|uniref:Uncharacterized protein n=1 Tax=uncultured bacterium (gcode 4) TaxID=1234023 RepID=K1XZA7_9BACT|nr:MAG: hypothetical protein ACD_78C00027G0004 [uncultured bacterium (gcode 4)]